MFRKLSKPRAVALRLLKSKEISVCATYQLQACRTISSRKSWIPESDDQLMRVTTQSMIFDVAEQQRETASKVVPWYLKNMPRSYFRQVTAELQMQHVKTISALRDMVKSDLTLQIESRGASDDSYQSTHISSANRPGLLHSQSQTFSVPAGYNLSNMKVYTAADKSLALNIFTFNKTTAPVEYAKREDAAPIFNYIKEVKEGKYANDPTVPAYSEMFTEKAMEEYINNISRSYAQHSHPRRFMVQRELYEMVKDNDSTAVHVEPHLKEPTTSEGYAQAMISIASANVLPEVLLRLCSGIVSAKHIDIQRAHLDIVKAPESSTPEMEGNVTMLRLLVTADSVSTDLNRESPFMKTLAADLKRAKWLDDEATDLGLHRHPELGLANAEIITALCSMLHGPLFKLDPQAYPSIRSIVQILDSNVKYIRRAKSIALLFLDKFHPVTGAQFNENEYEKRAQDILQSIGTLQNDAAVQILTRMVDAVGATMRTNFYNENRYALSMRVNPIIMATGEIGKEKPLPFGVFFCHGRLFNAFHCRFRDIARGGLRIVSPQNSDQYALESSRQFDEVYGLSYAQQLKNKDIPEGGAKAVILVNTPSINQNSKFFAMRKSVKAFADSILDLIIADSLKGIVDYYGKEELIYLGPDEQIIPSDIDWIVNRAEKRGYPIPAAFMSSKKEAGFNHKEFGVTSEGVNVYLAVALKSVLNIDPHKDPFTIKITGGPDGDVAGNLIRILFRDYGSNCKIVGIADGFGVAEDPNGLDAGELLRLFEAGLPITSFDVSKLSPIGVALPSSTDEGMQRRNTMHFRVKADAFVPAGGRPNTINAENWRNFLDPVTGKPSSPLIVEGANLFLTAEAREKLFEHGKVAIVKDSSANKCGVITSSTEIIASMLVSKEEFLSIKTPLVEDVLKNLRELARLEGELLFREYSNYPGALPKFSERISYAINKVTDAITDALANVEPEDPLFKELLPLIHEILPAKLEEIAGDRISSKLPVQYQRNAIASRLASKIVYKEGIHLIEYQPDEELAKRAFAYYRAEKELESIISKVKADGTKSDPAVEGVVTDLLERGGARTYLRVF